MYQGCKMYLLLRVFRILGWTFKYATYLVSVRLQYSWNSIVEDPEGLDSETHWEVVRESHEGLARAGFSQHLECNINLTPGC